MRYVAKNTNDLRVNRPSIGSNQTASVRLSYSANLSPEGKHQSIMLALPGREILNISSDGINIDKHPSSARLDERKLSATSVTSGKTTKPLCGNNRTIFSHSSEVNILWNNAFHLILSSFAKY